MDKSSKDHKPKRKPHGDYSKFYKKAKPSKNIKPSAPKSKDKKPFGKKEKPHPMADGKGEAEVQPYTRLNKYIANSGVCSRREADELIIAGVIRVNGQVVSELGTKVGPGDKVQYEGQTLSPEKLQYVLLNKPKGFITTTDDPFARKTVMNLVGPACSERIYPVGRLDMATTGLILFTNDGPLAKKLTHPKHRVKKVYHVILDKALKKEDLEKIIQGFDLDDGFIQVDKIGYDVRADNQREIGIELHSGRNRIVRRLFEALGYKVYKLDRTMFAGLTKKDVPRGRWRHLTFQEINMLKRMG